VQAYQNGDESAFDRLVEQNKGIIGKVENKWHRMVTERLASTDEIHSECLFAFYQSVKDYSSELDCKFITYASRQMDWRMNRFYQKYSPKGMNGVVVRLESLDAPLLGAEDLTLCDTIPDESATAELEAVFSRVENYLFPGGIFIFDFNTDYKYREVIGNTTIAENREDCSFIWDNYYDSEAQINEYDLTVFVREEGEKFRRFTENHFQRGYSPEQMAALAVRVGLQLVEITDADTGEDVEDESERIYFVVRKLGTIPKDQGV